MSHPIILQEHRFFNRASQRAQVPEDLVSIVPCGPTDRTEVSPRHRRDGKTRSATPSEEGADTSETSSASASGSAQITAHVRRPLPEPQRRLHPTPGLEGSRASTALEQPFLPVDLSIHAITAFQMCGDLTLSTPFRASVRPRASMLNLEDRARLAAAPRGASCLWPLLLAVAGCSLPELMRHRGESRRVSPAGWDGSSRRTSLPTFAPRKGRKLSVARYSSRIFAPRFALVRGKTHTRTGSGEPARPGLIDPEGSGGLCQLPALVESERLTFGRSCKLSTCPQERVFRSVP